MKHKTKVYKRCITCKCSMPKDKEYFRYDKRRIEPYGSCIECINKRSRQHYAVKKSGIYGTDKDICKRVRVKNLPKDLIELERLRLILLNRIKNNEHLVVKENLLLCKVCNKTSPLILPITFTLFSESIKSFTEIHKHE